jgi:hypothetical protein
LTEVCHVEFTKSIKIRHSIYEREHLGSNLWLIQPTAFVAHLRLIHSIRGRGLGRNESGA